LTTLRSVGTDAHLDVHEERPGGLDELLELVLAELGLGGGVEEIDSESLRGPSKDGSYISFGPTPKTSRTDRPRINGSWRSSDRLGIDFSCFW
jgi:hypothetical protein